MLNGFSLSPNRLTRSMCHFHTHWILTTLLLNEPCVILVVPVVLWLWIRLHFGKLSHECVHMVKNKCGQISTYTKLHAKLGKVEWGRWNRFMAAFQLWFLYICPNLLSFHYHLSSQIFQDVSNQRSLSYGHTVMHLCLQRHMKNCLQHQNST